MYIKQIVKQLRSQYLTFQVLVLVCVCDVWFVNLVDPEMKQTIVFSQFMEKDYSGKKDYTQRGTLFCRAKLNAWWTQHNCSNWATDIRGLHPSRSYFQTISVSGPRKVEYPSSRKATCLLWPSLNDYIVVLPSTFHCTIALLIVLELTNKI